MSKRLFILGSLLETHPRRAPTEARVWTPVVVEAEIGGQRGGAPGRAAIGPAIDPLPEQRLDETLGLPVGLGPVGPREALADRPPLADGGKDPGAVGLGVVREQPPDADAPPTKPGQRALEKGRTRQRIRRRQDLGAREARRVIDSDVQILPAGLPVCASRVSSSCADPESSD